MTKKSDSLSVLLSLSDLMRFVTPDLKSLDAAFLLLLLVLNPGHFNRLILPTFIDF